MQLDALLRRGQVMIIRPSSPSAMANAAARAATSSSSCFVYGTLMSPDVLRELVGRVPAMIPKAILRDHSRHPVRGRVYPGVVPSPSATVQGVLLLDITPLEMKCLDWFEEEGVDYARANVECIIPAETNAPNDRKGDAGERTITTNAYIWSLGSDKLDLSCDWDYNKFVEEHLEWYLKSTVRPCRQEIEREVL